MALYTGRFTNGELPMAKKSDEQITLLKRRIEILEKSLEEDGRTDPVFNTLIRDIKDALYRMENSLTE